MSVLKIHFNSTLHWSDYILEWLSRYSSHYILFFVFRFFFFWKDVVFQEYAFFMVKIKETEMKITQHREHNGYISLMTAS